MTILFVRGPSAPEALDGDRRVERLDARDAAGALDALAKSDAALAVVDMSLEGLRGAEGWGRVRDAWRRSVVVLCGPGDDPCRSAALEGGAEDALRLDDPSLPALLGAAIARALTRGRAARPEVELHDLRDRWAALDAARRWFVMEIDADDRITYLNRTAYGSVESVRGQSVYVFTHPDAHADVRARLEHVRRTGEEVTVEERAHGTLGDDHWFAARCLPVKRDGRVVAVLVVTEDVTERHRMEQQMARSERRFRALIEKSSDAIVLLDPSGRASYASPGTTQLLGYTPEEIVGRDFTLLIHPEDLRSVLEARATVHAKAGGHVTNDVRLRHKDGTWRTVHGTGTNLLDDPAVGAVVGNYRDVTAQRTLEEQVQRAQKWEAIGLLAGGIAHDFNNLLCIIMTAASAAASTGRDGRHAAALEDINQAAARAAELTRKLLSLGRKQPLAMVHLDGADLLSDFASLMRRSLGADIEVELSCERPLPIHVDRLQIEQVLLNVCTNARQAIQGRGRVKISARIHREAGEPVVAIVVEDDGPGMDEATCRRVFEPCFTTKPDGSGLGLTVSYGIVQRHGGSMRVDSRPGQGTTVTIHLPVRPGVEDARPARDPAAGPSAVKRTRVLVGEDEPSLRRILCEILRGAGHDVLEAADGNEAVATFAADSDGIDLVVLDVRMPGKSGPAAYEEMRRTRDDLRVLFITGHAPDGEVVPGGAPLLVKPFSTDAILRAVAQA